MSLWGRGGEATGYSLTCKPIIFFLRLLQYYSVVWIHLGSLPFVCFYTKPGQMIWKRCVVTMSAWLGSTLEKSSDKGEHGTEPGRPTSFLMSWIPHNITLPWILLDLFFNDSRFFGSSLFLHIPLMLLQWLSFVYFCSLVQVSSLFAFPHPRFICILPKTLKKMCFSKVYIMCWVVHIQMWKWCAVIFISPYSKVNSHVI